MTVWLELRNPFLEILNEAGGRPVMQPTRDRVNDVGWESFVESVVSIKDATRTRADFSNGLYRFPRFVRPLRICLLMVGGI
jgi:hypothetical protein